MGHRDGGPVAHAPALVGESERRSGAADGIQSGPAVRLVDDGRRRTAFGHRLVVETPELPPGDFGLRHEEAGDADPLLRAFVRAAPRLVRGAAEEELAARDGHHPDGGVRAGNGLGEGLEPFGGGRRLINLAGAGVHGALELLMRVAFDVMAGIEVAAHAVELELLVVFVVVEVGGDAVVADAFGVQVLVAFHAGSVVDDARGIVHLALGRPVDVLLVIHKFRPHVLGSHPELDHVVADDAVLLGRQMTGGAVGDYAAFIQVMVRLFPEAVGLFVVVAAHAGVVGGRIGVHGDEGQHQRNAQCQAAQDGSPDDVLFLHVVGRPFAKSLSNIRKKSRNVKPI